MNIFLIENPGFLYGSLITTVLNKTFPNEFENIRVELYFYRRIFGAWLMLY
jgi:hypothetical protein